MSHDSVVDPLELMLQWLPSNAVAERPVMALSTIDADGDPDSRAVLLSSADRVGLRFHTDATSRKVSQLSAYPRASLLIWPAVGRQLVVSGAVEPESVAAAAHAYALRPPYLQKLAWTNTAALAQLPVDGRRAHWSATSPPAEPPPNWAGFVLRPTRLTFWTADAAGPSNRAEYRRGAGGWKIQHLPG